jgi:hypothetical protein
MSRTKQRYALRRDDTLIAADLPDLAAIKKFAREDARREYSQARPACYVITGSSGFKRVGSHCKGTIRWEDQSQVHSRFGTPSINQPSAAPQAVQQLSRGSLVSPSKAFTPSALANNLREVLDQPGAPKPAYAGPEPAPGIEGEATARRRPDPAQKTIGFTEVIDGVNTP